MNSIAIIPARGGSKRIPGKNIKNFAGLPIIAYSIRAALESELFNRVIVSTDSFEIAAVARKYGAEVPFMRPADLADDFAGTDSVVVHALGWLAECGDTHPYFCCIYPTAPFIRADLLRHGLEIIKAKDAVSAFTVTSYEYPIFRSLRINASDRVELIWPEYAATRSQDLSMAYHDAGQFYWGDVKRYLSEKRLFSKDSVPIIIPRKLVQDIDTEEDWEIAELMFEAQRVQNASTGSSKV